MITNQTNTQEVYNKYTIISEQFEYDNKVKFLVRVLNNNAKNPYRAQKYYYSFGTDQNRRDQWIVDFKKQVDEYEAYKAERKANRVHNVDPTNAVVKQALVEKFGFKNVSVKSGRGTASSWVEAYVKVDAIECADHELYKNDFYPRCECRKLINKLNDEANEAVYKAMKENNLSFSTYCADDGYNSEHDEFLLQVSYK